MDGKNSKQFLPQFRSSNSPFPDPLNDKKLRVWIGSIPCNIDVKELLSALKDAGVPPVTDIILKKCPVRSWGFLSFRTSEDAHQCIRLIHGKCLFPESGFTIEARFANPHEVKDNNNHDNATGGYGRGESGTSYNSNLLSMANRNSVINTLSQDNYDVFQDAGDTTLWHMYKDENYIPYYYNSITGHTQWERPIPPLLSVEAATSNDRSRMVSAPGTNLFIFHIPNCWDDVKLAMHFTPFGNLVSAKVQKDAAGCNAGFGFVSYDNVQGAAAAVRLMNGFSTDSKFLKVEYKKKEGAPE